MTIKGIFRRAAGSAQDAQAFISEKLDDLSITSSLTAQEKDPNFGTNPIVKTFYEGKGSCGGQYNWVETPPKQLKEKTARAYDRVAIKLYSTFIRFLIAHFLLFLDPIVMSIIKCA